MSPEFEAIRSKRAFLVPLSVAVAAAISACGAGTKTETIHEKGEVRTVREVATPHHKHHEKHHGPTEAEKAEAQELKEEKAEAKAAAAEARQEAAVARELELEAKIVREAEVQAEIDEAEGSLEAAPGGAGAPEGSAHYSHGSHSSHSSHSSHVSSYGGEYGGGHVSHSSHSSHYSSS